MIVTASFGATILGLVAIGQIKRSKGRLYGMPLAVFDTLVFPLLSLDAVVLAVGGLAWLALDWFLSRPNHPDMPGSVALGLALLLDLLLFAGPLAWINWRIIRGVWRNVTGHELPTKPVAGIPATPATRGGEMPPPTAGLAASPVT